MAMIDSVVVMMAGSWLAKLRRARAATEQSAAANRHFDHHGRISPPPSTALGSC
jgi:hypothetical protein